jgi:hypothetical protein
VITNIIPSVPRELSVLSISLDSELETVSTPSKSSAKPTKLFIVKAWEQGAIPEYIDDEDPNSWVFTQAVSSPSELQYQPTNPFVGKAQKQKAIPKYIDEEDSDDWAFIDDSMIDQEALEARLVC